MAPRLRTSIVLAFVILVLYLVLSRSDVPLQYGEHPLDALKGNPVGGEKEEAPVLVEPTTTSAPSGLEPKPAQTSPTPVIIRPQTSTSSAKVVEPTVSSQEEFRKEYDALGL